MRRSDLVLLAVLQLCRARQHGFSIHDDLLAYPQFEVVFSDTYISELDAQLLVQHAGSSDPSHTAHFTTTTDRVGQVRVSQAAAPPPSDARHGSAPPGADDGDKVTDGTSQVSETYEIMHLPDSQSPSSRYLCAIPVLAPPEPLDSTATELAKAEEARELRRAQARGWELVSELDGSCLYFVHGWWSYTFCFGRQIVQFHALPNAVDKYGLPVRDPDTLEYVLGRVPPSPPGEGQKQQQQQPKQAPKQLGGQEKGAGAGGEAPHTGREAAGGGSGGSSSTSTSTTPILTPPKAEVAVKGDQRYLVQRLDGGTICDLTGRERTIEVQYHCLPAAQADRIGWIKEVTTCTYLMVINTPRLCEDVAFLPPKETRAHAISCRSIVASDEDIEEWHRRKAIEALEAMGVNPATGQPLRKPEAQGQQGRPGVAGSKQAGGSGGKRQSPHHGLNIGGVVIGGRQTIPTKANGEPAAKLPVPRGYVAGQKPGAPLVEVLVSSRGTAEGGEVSGLTDAELEKMALDPKVVEELWRKLREMAGDKGWKLQMVEIPGQVAEIRGVIDPEEEEEEDDTETATKKSQGRDKKTKKEGKTKGKAGDTGGEDEEYEEDKVEDEADGSWEKFFKDEL